MTNTAALQLTDDSDEQGNPLDFHREIYTSTLTNDPIHVSCWCPIGRTHTYDEVAR